MVHIFTNLKHGDIEIELDVMNAVNSKFLVFYFQVGTEFNYWKLGL